MPLTLVLGPANSAKAGAVLGAYGEAAARGGILVVPTVADAEHYRREVAAAGAVLGTVTTFAGLAGEIARRAGYAQRSLTALGRERLLRRVIGRARLEQLAASAASRGFAATAAALISELERALVTPQRFHRAMEAWGAAEPDRAQLGVELAALYRGYAAELDRLGAVDPDLFTWRALDALRAAPERWAGAPVFLYGFDDLTRLERDAVETLAHRAGAEVTVSLTYEPIRAAFLARAGTVEELRPLASRVVELEPLDEHYAPASRAALHHLERTLFESAEERVDPGRAIRLLEAGGARAEAELVAHEVVRELRRGVPADEVAVVCRSPQRDAPLLERVLADYGVSAWSDRRTPFEHARLGRRVLALARCAWSPQARFADLIAVLRLPGGEGGPDGADAAEFELRRAGIATVEGALRHGLDVPDLAALRDAPDPAAALAARARALLVTSTQEGGAPILDGPGELDARAFTALSEALAELEAVGERPAGGELVELLEGLELAPAAFPAGAVRIEGPLGIRARRFRTVVICALQEGTFPLSEAPDPFLSDEDRRAIARASGLRLEPREDSLGRERYLFYAAVSRATESLVLSYASSDEEGNLVQPSPFLEDVEDVLASGWREHRRRRLLADVVWGAGEAPTARERERARVLARAEGGGGALEPQPGRRLSQRALQEARHRRIVSAGALETYASCPVRWLVESELSPARLEPDPDPLLRGSYIHEVLEEVIGRLAGPVTEASLPQALEILEEVLATRTAPGAAGRPAAVRQGAATAIAADLRRYLGHEARSGCDWVPQALEQRFGFDDEDETSLPPLVLGHGEEEVRVRGVIDRVDVEPGGRAAIVRDYKSGSGRPEHQGARWSADRQLQVALYMIVARRLLGVEPVAGVYQPLAGGDLRPRGIVRRESGCESSFMPTDVREDQAFDAVLDDAAERAVELARRLREGEITPCPQTCSRDGCRYPGICRSG